MFDAYEPKQQYAAVVQLGKVYAAVGRVLGLCFEPKQTRAEYAASLGCSHEIEDPAELEAEIEEAEREEFYTSFCRFPPPDDASMYAGGDSGYAAADFGLEAYADMLMQDAGLRL